MRSTNRRHERESFFKYMSVDTARKVLSSRALRWSSPLLFNDPFDLPRELSFGITPEELMQACGKRMTDLLEQPADDISSFQPKLQLILAAIKRGVSSELRAELLAGVRDVVASQSPTVESMEALRAQWRVLLPEKWLRSFDQQSPIYK